LLWGPSQMSSVIDATEVLTPNPTPAARLPSIRKKIWIDLDNSPHVPFFVPIIPELRARGIELFITARDSYQVVELLKYYGIEARVIGRHYGKHRILKLLGTLWRGIALTWIARNEKIDISLMHGSRGCQIASGLLGIQNITISDYEHTARFSIKNMTVIYPEIIPTDGIKRNGVTFLKYPGIKEDVYLPSFHPDPTLRKRLGIAENDLLVTVRPPATEAHYHNPESEALLTATLEMFCKMKDTCVLLLPRNKNQEKALRAEWGLQVTAGKIVIPAHVEDGMNIIWNSDLVVSGGGTMNREAAAMGVPVYSIFRGTLGAVDRFLSEQGRLVLLENVEQVRSRIRAVRRDKESLSLNHQKSAALETIVKHITDIASQKNAVAQTRTK
jgi:predicted glycosyltransferase